MVFSLAPVVKLRIISPQKFLDPVVETLYSFGAIQVEQSGMPELDRPMPRFEQISDYLVRLRSIEKRLELDESIAKPARGVSAEQLFVQAGKIDFDYVRKLDLELEDVEDRLSKVEEKYRGLEPFKDLRVDYQTFHKPNSRLKFVYFALKPGELLATIEKLKGSLESFEYEMTLVESGGNHYVLLAYDKRSEDKVSLIVLKFARQLMSFPTIEAPSYQAEFGKVDGQRRELLNKKRDLEEKMKRFSDQHALQIVRLRKSLEIESKKAILPVKFGKTRNLFVVEGWIKSDRRQEIEKMLEKITDGAVVIEKIESFEEPPTIMENPAIIRPFEFLVKFFSLPNAHEFDPTIFISFFFPLFFGMILGDIAYGISAIILALFIRFKMKGEFLQAVGGMMLLSGISTTIFGFIYGEFLGVESVFGLVELHPYIFRLGNEGVVTLMTLAIAIGIIHVSLGFSIGAVTNFVHGHMKHAIGKASWVGLVLGTTAAVSQFVAADLLGKETLFLLSNVGSFVVLVSFIGVLYGEGMTGLIELFGVISNIFSYLRLMALGVAAAILANLISKIPVDVASIIGMFTGAVPFDMFKILLVVAAAGLFVVGHALALALGLFEGSIHSMRLHFVEFFSKFYKGGGRKFIPLRLEGTE